MTDSSSSARLIAEIEQLVTKAAEYAEGRRREFKGGTDMEVYYQGQRDAFVRLLQSGGEFDLLAALRSSGAAPPTNSRETIQENAKQLRYWIDTQRTTQHAPQQKANWVMALQLCDYLETQALAGSSPSPAPERPAPTTWQPIETAPQTGDLQLVWTDDDRYWLAYRYYDEDERGRGFHVWREEATETVIEPQPTHWMPLPQGPDLGR